MEFIAPKHTSSYLKVIGVGGAGTNAVNNMYRQGFTGIDYIVCNTDAKALEESPVPTKINLESHCAGMPPEAAKQLALKWAEEIKEILSENTTLLFIVAGMGGATGTGAAPEIARIAKTIELNDKDFPKITVVALVTTPFGFEGEKRMEQAMAGIEELRKCTDAIMIIDNNKLLEGEKKTFRETLAKIDEAMSSTIRVFTDMITLDAVVCVDLRDIQSIMTDAGDCFVGSGIAEGKTRVLDAALQALTKPLSTVSDISSSQKLLLHFTCSKEHEITTQELEGAFSYLTGVCVKQPTILWGIGYDNTLGEKVRVTIIATNFKKLPQCFDDMPPGIIDCIDFSTNEKKRQE